MPLNIINLKRLHLYDIVYTLGSFFFINKAKDLRFDVQTKKNIPLRKGLK